MVEDSGMLLLWDVRSWRIPVSLSITLMRSKNRKAVREDFLDNIYSHLKRLWKRLGKLGTVSMALTMLIISENLNFFLRML